MQAQDLCSLLDLLEKAGIKAVVYKSLKDQYAELASLENVFVGSADLDEHIDALISLGGDGTLLDTVCLVRDKQIPVLGINYGRLGFLASLGKENIEEAVLALQERTYVLDRRKLLHLDASVPLFGEEPFALNEVVIHKREFSPMIKIHTYLNGEFLNTFWSDGLILSTPTGSTGYSLSCNGPVVFPESESFVITPIAPHNLNIRPIVIPNNNVISFEVAPPSKYNKNIPPDIDKIVLKALKKELPDRYQSGQEMLFALEYYMYHDRYGPTCETLAEYLKKVFGKKKVEVVKGPDSKVVGERSTSTIRTKLKTDDSKLSE